MRLSIVDEELAPRCFSATKPHAHIRERTKAGLAAARARGRKGGRPSKMTPAKLKMAMTLMADQSNLAVDVAAQLDISTSTLFRYVDGKGNPKASARSLLGLREPSA